MNTEEKLRHFLETSMEDAQNQSEQMISEYVSALESIFEEHRQDTDRRMQLRLKTEQDTIKREKNKELSIKQLAIKRQINDKNKELTDMIFVEVLDMLEKFMRTPEYELLLERQIKEAAKIAGKDEMTIYIDPADASILNSLERITGRQITVSNYSFMGGTRVVIPRRNVLIDNSFEKKLAKAKENFNLGRK